MTIKSLLDQLNAEFRKADFDCPAFESRQILQEVLGMNAAELVVKAERNVDEPLQKKVLHWCSERLRGVPLAYLTGHRGFYKHDFFVEPGVLVPRPETELVVEEALHRTAGVSVKHLADLGAGTGCIGLSLIKEWPDVRLVAVDASGHACSVIRKNAEALGVEARTTIVHQPVEEFHTDQQFDVVVANPPYIAVGDPEVQASVHEHEPHEALYAADNGLKAVRAWSRWAFSHLAPGGLFVCEFGAGQTKAVEEIISETGFQEVKVAKDLAGHDRVISAQRMR